MKVTAKQPKRERLWLNVAHAHAASPHANYVWYYDFVQDWTHDGRAFRTLNVIDECTRECLTIKVKKKLNSIDVIDVLTDLFIMCGALSFVRSDNGP